MGRRAEWGARLAAEADVLGRLTEHQPYVPAFIDSAKVGDDDLYLFDHLPGTSMTALIPSADPVTITSFCRQVGEHLRRIHSWEPEGDRPTAWWDEHFADAVRRGRGALDSTIQLHGVFEGRPVRELLDVAASRPDDHVDDVVWTFGDPCLPNWLVNDGQITAAIDWPDACYADRRFDLATALWTIPFNVQMTSVDPDEMNRAFLDGYGFDGDAEDLLPYIALDHILDRVSFAPPG